MNMLTKFFADRRERRVAMQYMRGYQYAAGALLAGDTTDTLRMLTDNSRAHGDFGPFDRGIEQACLAWTAHNRKLRRRL